jgi:hypothetical protein
MKRYSATLLGLLSIAFLVNMSSEETTVGNSKKNAVNFSGSITYTNGVSSKIDNIAIGGVFKNIVLYRQFATPETNTYILAENPQKRTKAKVNLEDIQEITVPAPTSKWVYQESKSQHTTNYVEIVVRYKEVGKKEDHFLVETSRKITYDKVDGAASEESPFTDITSLVITGYGCRTPEQPKQLQCAPN